MSAFVAVACQHCRKGKIGELVAGMARFQCPRCSRRTIAGLTLEGELHYVAVDRPLRLAQQSLQIA